MVRRKNAEDIKKCVDCFYHVNRLMPFPNYSVAGGASEDLCTHPSFSTDPVTGRYSRTYCKTLRADENLCGIDANYFEGFSTKKELVREKTWWSNAIYTDVKVKI